jgi:hypothetical protein
MAKLWPSRKQTKDRLLTIGEIVGDDIARFKEPNKYRKENEEDDFI